MTNYLVEIGTEELPYKFIPSAIEQLKATIAEKLVGSRISYKNIKVFGAPRRLAVIIEDISEFQPDLTREIKGPPAKVAFDANGNLTQAGIGFAKKQGLKPSSLYKETAGDVEYVFAEINEKGKNVRTVLQDLIPDIVLKLQGSHFMRWGHSEIKFSRPIRWIVSLLDTEEVKIKIGNVESTSYSKGHRFFTSEQVKINSPETYVEELYKAQVIVDQEVRKQRVIELAVQSAEKVNGRAVFDPKLVEEVAYIVEWPVPVVGTFDKKYLVVPQEVIVTVMASHQRYFPVFAKDGETLLNCFITMSNYNKENLDNVIAGNERVIKARLDDAIFFYTEDTKRTLDSRIEDLKGVTFQKGLGSMYDKAGRIQEIASFIAKKLNLDNLIVKDAERAALLCKADLVTALVREFTELQGVIGSEYARLDKENDNVSNAIEEHYMPISSEGELAKTITGQIVCIADKMDTISGVFSIGKSPTGSADPLGLRRAALGIISTLINQDIDVNLTEIIPQSISVQPIKVENIEKLTNDIREFIVQRLKNHLNDTYRYDVVEAVLSSNDPLVDVKDVKTRAELLSKLVLKPEYSAFHESAIRIHRIIKSDDVNLLPSPSSNLFVHEIEGQLWDCAKSIEHNTLDYDKLVEKLEECIPFIEKFFENVLVMDKNEKIKDNRLSLLGNIRNKFLKLADFSKIVVQ